MPMLKIAFDIDGVCVALDKLLFPILYEMTGNHPPYQEHSYSIEDTFNADRETVDKALATAYARWHEIPIYPNVEEIMHKLYEKAKEPIYFVTARSPKYANDTFNLVNRFCEDIPFTIAFCGDAPKTEYLKRYSVFVDDRLKTAKEIAAEKKIVFMPDKPYNKTDIGDPLPYIVRIEGVGDLLYSLDEFVE